jgi:predicted RNase H-like HicB family nuclease
MFHYPVIIEQDADTQLFMVEFIDIPGSYAVGESYEEALLNAVEALELAVISMIYSLQAIPLPSSLEGRPSVAVPASLASEVALHNALLGQN